MFPKTKTKMIIDVGCGENVWRVLSMTNVLRKVSDSFKKLHLFKKKGTIAMKAIHAFQNAEILAGGGFGGSISAGHCNAWTIWENHQWQHHLKGKCPGRRGGGCFPSDAQVPNQGNLF